MICQLCFFPVNWNKNRDSVERRNQRLHVQHKLRDVICEGHQSTMSARVNWCDFRYILYNLQSDWSQLVFP
jgi:hypothetical protein